MLSQYPGQPVPVCVTNDLGNAFLNMAVGQQPVYGSLPQLLCLLGLAMTKTKEQGIPEQIVITKPLVPGVEGDQEQVLAKQLLQDFLAVPGAADGIT